MKIIQLEWLWRPERRLNNQLNLCSANHWVNFLKSSFVSEQPNLINVIDHGPCAAALNISCSFEWIYKLGLPIKKNTFNTLTDTRDGGRFVCEIYRKVRLIMLSQPCGYLTEVAICFVVIIRKRLGFFAHTFFRYNIWWLKLLYGIYLLITLYTLCKYYTKFFSFFIILFSVQYFKNWIWTNIPLPIVLIDNYYALFLLHLIIVMLI